MISIENIDTCLQHPMVREIYGNYKECLSPDSPDINYFGINFDPSGIRSLKFYFAFFRKMKPEEVLRFLPHSRDFDKYYHLWDETRSRSLEHSGCTFELKFNAKMEPITGFHFRMQPVKESYDLIGMPEQLPFDALSLGTRPGINYEYSAKGVLRKKYYYFESPEHKKYIADRFNKPFASKASVMEYTESDQFSKVNIWRLDYSDENLNRPDYFTSKEREVINHFREKYGLLSVSDGFYEKDGIRATYFFNAHDHPGTCPFNAPSNHNIDTVSLFL